MHHLAADGRAQRLGEAVVVLERRHAAGLADDRLGEVVELDGRDAGSDRLPDKTKSPGADAPGLSHGLDLCCRLADDHEVD